MPCYILVLNCASDEINRGSFSECEPYPPQTFLSTSSDTCLRDFSTFLPFLIKLVICLMLCSRQILNFHRSPHFLKEKYHAQGATLQLKLLHTWVKNTRPHKPSNQVLSGIWERYNKTKCLSRSVTRAATLRGWCPRPLDDGAK